MRTTRTAARAALAVGAVLLGTAISTPQSTDSLPRPKRPNILFLFSDDHGAQAISAYGSNRNRTPSIDRLADEGMRFANCFCTNSICAPSRATILTGVHTHVSGLTTNERVFDTRQQMFPELLRGAGYQTAIIGKWHLNAEPVGFDYWDLVINQGTYYNPPMIRNGSFVRRTGYTTDIITDLALEWLRDGRDPDKPFLLMCQHKAPHRSWEPALRHIPMYEDSLIAEPPTLFDDWSNRSTAWSYSEMSIERHLNPADLHLVAPAWQMNAEQLAVWDSLYTPMNRAFERQKLAGRPLVRWKYQRYAKDYLRTVAALDEGIGRVLAYLDESGLAANTIVIYSSDQGWMLGEHGMFDKRWMYEETLRMPLLVRWPGVIRPGSVNTDLVQNLDFAETFLDLAGVPVPSRMQGRSLVPLFMGLRPDDWRTSVYYQFYEDRGPHKVPRHYGIRTDRYKLIHYYQLKEWELFDLARDPDELNSLYAKPEYAETAAQLTVDLDSLRNRYGVSDDADLDADRFQTELEQRRAFLSLLGRMPSRYPHEVTLLSATEGDGYRREHIAYTIGGQRVEAFVLIPSRRPRPLPALLAIHPGPEAGSFARGKSLVAGLSGDASLAYGLEMCKRGYIVICPDRIGFESRRFRAPAGSRLGDEALRRRDADRILVEGGTLLGHELSALWFAADYVSRRPEAHMLRVGAIGHGEGGMLALLLAYVNPEIRATVVSNGISAFNRHAGMHPDSLMREIPPLLSVPGLMAWGDLDQMLCGVYPRPLLLIDDGSTPGVRLESARARYANRSFTDALIVDHRAQTGARYGRTMTGEAAGWFDAWLTGRHIADR